MCAFRLKLETIFCCFSEAFKSFESSKKVRITRSAAFLLNRAVATWNATFRLNHLAERIGKRTLGTEEARWQISKSKSAIFTHFSIKNGQKTRNVPSLHESQINDCWKKHFYSLKKITSQTCYWAFSLSNKLSRKQFLNHPKMHNLWTINIPRSTRDKRLILQLFFLPYVSLSHFKIGIRNCVWLKLLFSCRAKQKAIFISLASEKMKREKDEKHCNWFWLILDFTVSS